MPSGPEGAPEGIERRFADHDVTWILRRAAELDHDDATGSPAGLSATDLEEIAGEAGIDPGLVARAIGELDRRRSRVPDHLPGSPVVAREIRSVPGRLSTEEREAFFRRFADRVRAGPEHGSPVRGARYDLELETTPQRTLVQVESRIDARVRRRAQLLPTALSAVVGLWAGVGLGSWAAGLLLPVVLGVGGWFVGFARWEGLAARSRSRARALADEIAGEATLRVEGRRAVRAAELDALHRAGPTAPADYD